MALQPQLLNHPRNQINGELLEKIILGNDLSGLTPIQKVEYVKNICQTIGLNPVTKPIQLMKFQNKEVPYFTKDASEQLRKNNRVSISNIETKVHDGGLYVVTAYATTPDGRQDCSTGAIVISGLKGDALANALMKAETKAKRRVTLSICGLGFIDELEVDSLPHAQKIDVSEIERHETKKIASVKEDESFDLSVALYHIENAESLEQLKKAFEDSKNKYGKTSPELLKLIVEAKDKRKEELMSAEFLEEKIEIDIETGEII
jgi:hypothetical protein